MQIGNLEGYGLPVWGPTKGTKTLLATGTWSGSSSEQSFLRVSNYEVGKGMALLGSAQSPTKFAALDWIDQVDEQGIVAGGMEDGAITLWNVKKICAASDTQQMGKGCICAAQIHQGVPVKSLEFNPHKKNLLASGGSEVLIQDISQNLKKPSKFKPGEPNFHEGSRITSISWNRVVPHILASASENGKIVVWDLKQSKSIFQFMEPKQDSTSDSYFGSPTGQSEARQASEIRMMWNPEVPLQFVVANDDDLNPSFNIWDLRNPAYPVATFQNIHQKGILSVSWCLSDPSLVVSSGKDERAVVTNFKTGESILEFPTQAAYRKIVWNQNLHGKIAALDTEGNTDILSLNPQSQNAVGAAPAEEVSFASPQPSPSTNKAYAPTWLFPKCGARFGFGGKLVTFNGKCLKVITQIQNQKEKELVNLVDSFDKEMQQAVHYKDVEGLIERKAKEADNGADKIELLAVKSLAAGSVDGLLKEFGFDKKKVTFEVERFLGKQIKRQEEAPRQHSVLNKPPVVTENPFVQDFTALTAEGAVDFFNQLGSSTQQSQKQEAQSTMSPAQKQERDDRKGSFHDQHGASPITDPKAAIAETISRNGNWNEGPEGMIKKNLMIGNLQYAAEVALKCGRSAEALLIAEQGGEELYDDIKQMYFQMHKDPFVKVVVQGICDDDLSGLTKIESLAPQVLGQGPPNPVNWRESLAYLFAYKDKEERNPMIKGLGDNLLKMREISAAIVCYILSQSVYEVLDLWKRRALHAMSNKEMTREQCLFDLLQKFVLFRLALESCGSRTGLLEANEDFNTVLAEVGRYMTSSEEAATMFMRFLLLPTQPSHEVASLKDRIFQAHEYAMQGRAPRPPLPYQIERVRVVQLPQSNQQQNRRGGHRGNHNDVDPGFNAQVNQGHHQPQQRNHGNQPAGGHFNDQQYQRPEPPRPGPLRSNNSSLLSDPMMQPGFGYGQRPQANAPPRQGAAPLQQEPQPQQPAPDRFQTPSQPPAQPIRAGRPQNQPQRPARPGLAPRLPPPNVPQQQPPVTAAPTNRGGLPSPAPPTMPGPMATGPPSYPQQPRPRVFNPMDQPTQNNQGPSQQAAQQPSDCANPMQSPQQPGQANRPGQLQPARPGAPSPGGVRPRFAPPRPARPITAPPTNPAAPQQLGQQHSAPVSMPPPSMPPSTGPPPMGSGVGPRPMAGRRTDASSGGSANSDAACSGVLSMVQDFVAAYSQTEADGRGKQEALDKAEVLSERLRTAQVSVVACEDLNRIFQGMAANDVNTARAAFTKLCQKQWAEVKDWSSCVKTFIAFRQRVPL